MREVRGLGVSLGVKLFGSSFEFRWKILSLCLGGLGFWVDFIFREQKYGLRFLGFIFFSNNSPSSPPEKK